MGISRTRRQAGSFIRNPAERRDRNAAVQRPTEMLEGRLLFATFTWDGGGGDANWQTAANWAADAAPAGDGTDVLVFPTGGGVLQKANVNDYTAGTVFEEVRLEAGGYSLGGNALTLGPTGLNDTSASGANAVSFPIAIGTPGIISDTAGNSSNALTVSGVVSGPGVLTRSGAGSVILTGANTYSGGTTLSAGNTYANNASGSAFGTGTVTNSSGALRGNGSFSGTLAHNADLLPGATSGATATLTAGGGINFGTGAVLGLNVNGATAGSGYDQLVVNGTVDVAGGQLTDTGSTFAPTGGEKLFILVNDSTDAVVGTFAGLAQGATLEINGADYTISYTGDSGTDATTGGNDIVLFSEEPNAAPTNSVPGSQTTVEDTAKVFSAANGNAITVADTDAGSADVRVALSADNGAAITLTSTGLITAGANGTSAVTITGSQTAVNAALDGLAVTPAANVDQDVTLTVLTSDLGNTGGGGAKTDTDTVLIDVSPVNDAPVNTVPATQTTATNTPKLFGPGESNAISVADPDAGAVTVTLTATNGTLTLGATSGLSIDGGDATDVASVTFTGSVNNVNAGLINTQFIPAADFIGAGSLQITTSDGVLSDTDTVTVNVAAPGTLAFSEATYEVGEGIGSHSATITVVRTGGTAGQIVVNYETTTGGTATAGTDYTAVGVTALTFADGETSKTFTVPVLDDASDEADTETVNLVLSGTAASGQTTSVLSIRDNEATPTVSIGDATVVEGDAGASGASFTVTLSEASARPIVVNYATADGTAAAGSDFSTGTGALTFTPGQTVKTIMVNATGDTADEDDGETFSVTLSVPEPGGEFELPAVTIADGTGAGLIADDDDAAVRTLGIAQDVSVTEGNTGTVNATFTVNLNAAAAGTVTVAYAVQAGTATANADYATASGILTFTAGQTSQTVTVPVIGDTTDEANQTFTLALSDPTGGATILDGEAVGTIVDNDAPPTVSVADGSGIEGTGAQGSVEFTFSLSAASEKEVAVAYSVGSGTATVGSDFQPLIDGREVTFAPGETTRTDAYPVTGDALDEADETFILTIYDSVLTSGRLNAVVGDGVATGTIADDDAPPTLSVSDVTVAEPSTQGSTAQATFTVTLSAASSKTITVGYMTEDGTAVAGSDYTASSGTLTFAPGETSKTVNVPVLFDTSAEQAETFSLVLTSPGNAEVTDGTGTATIGIPNAAPVGADDVASLAAGQASADVAVLANDTDGDGDILTVESVTAPAHGTASVNMDGTVRYTPAAGYSGPDAFTYTVMDENGATDTAEVTIAVAGNGTAVNPTDPKKTDVFVAGTAASDQIQVVRVGRQVRVVINGVEQGTYTANGNVVISGGDGDDNLVVGKVKNAVVFNGGDGNDTLAGGAKGDILVGGPGNDTLNGGAGRDIIIGGGGADTLTGLGGNDILIAGTTSYDADTLANRAALNDLLAELARGGRYATKLANLAAGVGTSGARLVANSTVVNDNDVDTLIGGGSQDFFAADTDGSPADVLTKRARNESVIELQAVGRPSFR